tara:strand:- start:1499 stop:3628 length:2130 start_codon:yes stop_codon:yes gene_type:complete
MSDKFLNTGGSGNANISNGTINAFVAGITVANLKASMPIKTNSVNTLVSTKLDITDINNLDGRLDTIISNPYVGDFKATDFETDDYFSINTELQKVDNFTASTATDTNLTGILKVPEVATGRLYDSTQSTWLALDGATVDVQANSLTGSGELGTSTSKWVSANITALNVDHVVTNLITAPGSPPVVVGGANSKITVNNSAIQVDCDMSVSLDAINFNINADVVPSATATLGSVASPWLSSHIKDLTMTGELKVDDGGYVLDDSIDVSAANSGFGSVPQGRGFRFITTVPITITHFRVLIAQWNAATTLRKMRIYDDVSALICEANVDKLTPVGLWYETEVGPFVLPAGTYRTACFIDGANGDLSDYSTRTYSPYLNATDSTQGGTTGSDPGFPFVLYPGAAGSIGQFRFYVGNDAYIDCARIINVSDPVALQDVSTKNYVDTATTGIAGLETKTQNISSTTTAGNTKSTGNQQILLGASIGGDTFSITGGDVGDAFFARIMDMNGTGVNTVVPLTTGVVRPDVDNTRDIGSPFVKYKDIYTDKVFADKIEVSNITAPANPGSGKGVIYKKTGSNGLFYKAGASAPEEDLTNPGTMVSAVDSVDCTSSSYVLMPDMILTPGAGTYLVMFGGNFTEDASGEAVTEYGIFNNGVLVAASRRRAWIEATNYYTPLSTQTITTVTDGQPIIVAWKETSGTPSVEERSLILVKVG